MLTDSEQKELLYQWCRDNGCSKSKLIDRLNSLLPDGSLWRFDVKNISCTHHLLAGGNFHITEEKMDDFFKMYAENLIPNNLGLCESVPNQPHNFFMDLDYRNLKDKLESDVIIEHVKYIVQIVSSFKDIEGKDKSLKVALLVNESKPDGKGTWKAGCHLVFNDYVSTVHHTRDINSFIVKRMSEMVPTYPWEEIVEKDLETLRMVYSGKVHDPGAYQFLCLMDECGNVTEEEDKVKIMKYSSIRVPIGVIPFLKGVLARIPRESISYDEETMNSLKNVIIKSYFPKLTKDIIITRLEDIVSGRSLSHMEIEIENVSLENTSPVVLRITPSGSMTIAIPKQKSQNRIKCEESLVRSLFPDIECPRAKNYAQEYLDLVDKVT